MAIQATPEMCYYCFNVLESHLESKQSPNPPSTIENTNAYVVTIFPINQ
jgi:AMMECR1 domain-containing protein